VPCEMPVAQALQLCSTCAKHNVPVHCQWYATTLCDWNCDTVLHSKCAYTCKLLINALQLW
jgi:hypothetical protein